MPTRRAACPATRGLAVSYPLRFGVTTFGDVPHRPGEDRLTDAATIREVVDQGKLARNGA